MTRRPEEFPRRVLALATGLTPQVVTETLYALAVLQDPPLVPTEIRLITTTEGAHRARLMLLDPDVGRFHALVREHGLEGRIAFGERSIHVIASAAGPLPDIRTPAENALAADTITRIVRDLCADPDAAVHVSIAGGRKSMGYYIGYALSLFGRPQDRLTHVLVNDPFESHTEFFYPPRRPQVLQGRDGRPVSTIDARIELAEIPFVRLRDGLPTELLTGDASFSETVAGATQRIATPTLEIRLAARRIRAGEREITLPPQLLAWYALFAMARIEGREDGALRSSTVDAERLLSLYAKVTPRLSADHENLAQLLAADGMTDTMFREKVAKINRRIKDQLGIDAPPYQIHPHGTRPRTGARLALPPGLILIV